MSRDRRETRKQDGTRMRHAIKHPVVHNVPTNNLIVPRHASLITISPSTSFSHEYEFSRTYARSRTNRPGHPILHTHIYIYTYRLEMDKNLKNEIIALITCVVTLQLTSHFFSHSQIELNLGKLHRGFRLLARYDKFVDL